MATLSIQANVTIDDFVEAVEQLQTAEAVLKLQLVPRASSQEAFRFRSVFASNMNSQRAKWSRG